MHPLPGKKAFFTGIPWGNGVYFRLGDRRCCRAEAIGEMSDKTFGVQGVLGHNRGGFRLG